MTTADRLPWRTSSYSGNGEGCVDVAPTDDAVLIRHSKHHDHGTILFTPTKWEVFVRESRVGLASTNGVATVEQDGTDTLVTSTKTQLRFNDIEWTAFIAGANDGEFDFRFAVAN